MSDGELSKKFIGQDDDPINVYDKDGNPLDISEHVKSGGKKPIKKAKAKKGKRHASATDAVFERYGIKG